MLYLKFPINQVLRLETAWLHVRSFVFYCAYCGVSVV